MALACAGSDTPAAPPEPTLAPTPAQAATQASDTPQPVSATTTTTTKFSLSSTPAPEPVAASTDYDPNRVMFELFPWFSVTSPLMSEALDQISEHRDPSMVPVLLEIIRFMPSEASRELIGTVLIDLTGQGIPSDAWNTWMEWLGRNLDSHQPPSQYAAWKVTLMGNLDPRYTGFLGPAVEFSRIDLTEVVWGGVAPDGIPDLRNPPMLTAAQADYLNDSDRVFGVTINGESRAYPLRIVNAHEMVNDTVGGEPISLLW